MTPGTSYTQPPNITHTGIASKLDFGKPHYPSIIHPERMQVLATSWNKALELALELTARLHPDPRL
jgi:hypothetical protein